VQQDTKKANRARIRVIKFLLALSVAGFVAGIVFYYIGLSRAVGAAVTAAFVLAACAVSVSRSFSKLSFTIWVLAFVACSLFYPRLFLSWWGYNLTDSIVPLVQVILFGMGMTLTFDDFARVLKMPKGIFIGFSLQYTVMPLMGFTFAKAFGLADEVAVGLILIGSCPGGVASNVISYIAGANVALSVTMTACSTVLSPVMTPLAMKLFAGRYVGIDAAGMMLSIFWMIIVPLIAGLLVNRYARRLAERLVRVLPVVAMLSICIIIAITIAKSQQDIVMVGVALLGASVCHNASGFTFGYFGGRILGMNKIDSKTVAIEVGMQNGGMATGLAFELFNRIVAMASAVFGPWSAIAGSALASYWRGQNDTGEERNS